MSLTQILTGILSSPDRRDAETALTEWLKFECGATIVELYFLSTQMGRFVNCADDSVLPVDTCPNITNSIVSQRDGAIVGFLESDVDLGILDSEIRSLVAAIIEELFRRRYIGGFLRNLRRPVDFTSDEALYFRKTVSLLADALSMEMVAIREYVEIREDGEPNGYNLRCKAFYDSKHGEYSLNKDFDEIPSPFEEVITKARQTLAAGTFVEWEPVPEHVNSLSPRYQFLKRDDRLKQVSSFLVFPIVTGKDFFGVVSCALTSPFSYSAVEIDAIRTAMQTIGVAISNFREFHEVRRLNETRVRDMASMTALEVAQVTRHELRNIQHEQAGLVLSIQAELKKGNLAEVRKIIAGLETSSDKLANSVNRLRFIDPGANAMQEKTTIRALWEGAVADLKFAIDEQNISIRQDGLDVAGYFYRDALHIAFVNLLLNSIDRFKHRKKQGRVITLTVKRDSLSDHSDRITCNYSDNAGGLDKHGIQKRIQELSEERRRELEGLQLREVVFQPQFTTKSKVGGGGYGLVLARRAAGLHGGSLRIEQDGEPGCVFKMDFEKSIVDPDRRNREK